MAKRKSMESSARRKARIAAAPQLRTRVVEDKTKYNRAKAKRETRLQNGDITRYSLAD